MGGDGDYAVDADIAIAAWDPINQTYRHGIVPSKHDMANDLTDLLGLNGDGKLRVFGYGSLCWHPGTDGVLSLSSSRADGEGDEGEKVGRRRRRKVTSSRAWAMGYVRHWCQRSADHRGTTDFNGVVCTLLSDGEVDGLIRDRCGSDGGRRRDVREEGIETTTTTTTKTFESTVELMDHGEVGYDVDEAGRGEGGEGGGGAQRTMRRSSMTEGVIYTIDPDLAKECLAELDFREKGVSRWMNVIMPTVVGNTRRRALLDRFIQYTNHAKSTTPRD